MKVSKTVKLGMAEGDRPHGSVIFVLIYFLVLVFQLFFRFSFSFSFANYFLVLVSF